MSQPGNVCTVTEVAPTPIPGYTWGTITCTPVSVTIDTKGGTFEITVENSITRDLGNLKIIKSFDPLTSGFTGTFAIHYDCVTGLRTMEQSTWQREGTRRSALFRPGRAAR